MQLLTQRTWALRLRSKAERLPAVVRSRLTAKVASSVPRQSPKKLTVKFSVQKTRRSKSLTTKVSSASSAMAPKSTEEDFPAEDAMDQATSRTSFTLILSRLSRRRSSHTQPKPSKDLWLTTSARRLQIRLSRCTRESLVIAVASSQFKESDTSAVSALTSISARNARSIRSMGTHSSRSERRNKHLLSSPALMKARRCPKATLPHNALKAQLRDAIRSLRTRNISTKLDL